MAVKHTYNSSLLHIYTQIHTLENENLQYAVVVDEEAGNSRWQRAATISSFLQQPTKQSFGRNATLCIIDGVYTVGPQYILEVLS